MIKITAGVTPDAWKEFCKIGIIPQNYPTGAGGGTCIEFAGITEDITAMDWGDKDIEGMALVNGGRVVKNTPMGDESITLKMYPVDALLDNGSDVANGVAQLFHPQSAEDSTEPIVVDNSIYRRKFGIIILWAETLPATSDALPDESKTAFRIQIINAYMTSYKLNYDDKILSAEVTFKWTPFAKDATRNKREESTDGTVQLAAAITSATSFS